MPPFPKHNKALSRGLWSPSLSLNNPLIRPAISWGRRVEQKTHRSMDGGVDAFLEILNAHESSRKVPLTNAKGARELCLGLSGKSWKKNIFVGLFLFGVVVFTSPLGILNWWTTDKMIGASTSTCVFVMFQGNIQCKQTLLLYTYIWCMRSKLQSQL